MKVSCKHSLRGELLLRPDTLPIVSDEDLIKWGWPEDVWFHVHNYSSAHVYLRLEKVIELINFTIKS